MNINSKIISILAIAGILLSAYMSYYHYQLRASPRLGWCDLGKFINCESVLLSKYSEVFGMPVAYLGVLWFAVLLVLSSFRFSFLGKNAESLLFLWCAAGLAVVTFFIIIELFILHSICILCTSVHILTLAISFLVFKRMKLF